MTPPSYPARSFTRHLAAALPFVLYQLFGMVQPVSRTNMTWILLPYIALVLFALTVYPAFQLWRKYGFRQPWLFYLAYPLLPAVLCVPAFPLAQALYWQHPNFIWPLPAWLLHWENWPFSILICYFLSGLFALTPLWLLADYRLLKNAKPTI